MKKFIILAKISAKFIYAILKLRKTQNKITMISRFNKETSVDFKLLQEEIMKRNPETKIVILNHKLKNRNHLLIDVLKEMYHISNSKSVIIDSYIIPISILNHKKSLKVIQIWHSIGVSKNFGYTAIGLKEGAKEEIAKLMNMHKNYDYVIASGNSSIEFYKKSFNITDEKILNIGIPRIDYLINKDIKKNEKEKLIIKYPELGEKKNILYAPTFRKGQKIPYDKIIKQIDFNTYNLIVKQHHLDKTKLDNENILKLNDENIFNLLFVTDYLITDYSAVMFEAALVDIPMFFYIYDIDKYETNRGLTISLKKDLPGVYSRNAKHIIKAIENNKYNHEMIKKFKLFHVDNLDGKSTSRIIDLI